jgi:hypothetical protein
VSPNGRVLNLWHLLNGLHLHIHRSGCLEGPAAFLDDDAFLWESHDGDVVDFILKRARHIHGLLAVGAADSGAELAVFYREQLFAGRAFNFNHNGFDRSWGIKSDPATA